MKRGRPTNIEIERIRIDGDTQGRIGIDESAVADYAAAMQAGEELPPIVVFNDGSDLWLADGFHRTHAARRIKAETIKAQSLDGTKADAAWFALAANRANGLRMTTADKERAVKRALSMRPGESNRAIADHVGVDDKTVARHRVSLESRAEIPHVNERQGRDGRTYPAPPVVDTDESPRTEAQAHTGTDTGSNSATDGGNVGNGNPPTIADVKDQLGHSITDDRLAEFFRRRHELEQHANAISTIRREVMKAIDAGDPLYADLSAKAFDADAANIIRALRAARPHATCPYCGGPGCKACRDRGIVNQLIYEQAPSEMKGSK